MSIDYKCPYCGAEFEDEDYWEISPNEYYEVDCYECGRIFEVNYELNPSFYVKQPDDLKVCTGDYSREQLCNYWNIFDDCCWYDHTKSGCHDMPTNEPCPLNHHGGEATLSAFERDQLLGVV